MVPPVSKKHQDDNSEPSVKRPKTSSSLSENCFKITTKSQSSLSRFFDSNNKKQSTVHTIESSASSTTAAAAAAAATTDSPATSSSPVLDTIVPQPVPFSKSASWSVYRQACLVRSVKYKPSSDTRNNSTKVAAFDLDGTLLTWRIAGWPSRMDQYELWNAHVVDKLRDLYDRQNYQLLIVSNQGAIRSALNGKKATHVKGLLEWVCHVLDRPVSVVLSTNKKLGYHKPSTLMWKVAEECCCQSDSGTWDKTSSFFVGDSIDHEDDRQGGVDAGFARNVGIPFYTPQEFFGTSHEELRKQQKQQGLTCAYGPPPHEAFSVRAALVGGYLQGPILLVLCGAQGSGKSTFCRQLLSASTSCIEQEGDNQDESRSHWVHLSQDTINDGKPGTREAVEKATKLALRDSRSVVVDRMHLDETQRSYFVNLAKEIGVSVHAVLLSPPKGIVVERVRKRENHAAGVQGDFGAKLATASIEKMVQPQYAERFALISVSGTVEGAARLVAQYQKVSSSITTHKPVMSFPLSPDVSVPSIALGTMGLGRKEAHGVVSKAAELGFDAFDTAPTYKNEDKIGEGLPEDSTSFVIVKVPKRVTDAAQLRQELTESLAKLKHEKVDLLLLHWPADAIATDSLKTIWSEMEACHREGLVRALGVCNFNVQALLLLLSQCQIQPAVNQVERHPLLPQWDLVDFCAQRDILLQAHSPLGHGSDELHEHEVIQSVSSRLGCSTASVLLKWNVEQGVAVVTKCRSEEHMRDVLSARTGEGLSAADMEALNKLKHRKRFVAPPFMYGKATYCWAERIPN